MKTIFSVLLLFLSLYFASSVYAVPVHVDFKGHYTSAVEHDLVGTHFDGYLDYDPEKTYFSGERYYIAAKGELDGYDLSWGGGFEVYDAMVNSFSFSKLIWGVNFRSAQEPEISNIDDTGFAILGWRDNGQFYENAWYTGEFEYITFNSQPVPEPSSIILFIVGLCGLVLLPKSNIKCSTPLM